MKNDLINKIVKNSGIIFFGNSMASVLNFVSFALMARAIGPELLATFVLAQAYSLILNDLFNIQTWESMVKFGATSFKKNNFRNIVKTNLILDCISAIIAFCVALLLLYPTFYLFHWDISNFKIIAIYVFSILFNITSLTIGIPRLFDKFYTIAKIQVFIAILRLMSIYGIFLFEKTLFYFVCIYLIFDIATNILLIFYALSLIKTELGGGWWMEKMVFDKKQLTFIWWTNLRTIIRIPVRHLDVLIIGYVISLPMLGYYKVYKEVAGIISRIGDPVNQAIFPEYAKLIGKGDLKGTVNVAKKTISLMLCVAFSLTIIFLLSANFIISSFFGLEYIEYMNVMYLMIIVSGLGFALVPIDSLFIAAGFARMSFYVLTFTNITYLTIAFLCGSYWGLNGIVSANAIQKFLNKFIKISILKKYSTGWEDIAR